MPNTITPNLHLQQSTQIIIAVSLWICCEVPHRESGRPLGFLKEYLSTGLRTSLQVQCNILTLRLLIINHLKLKCVYEQRSQLVCVRCNYNTDCLLFSQRFMCAYAWAWFSLLSVNEFYAIYVVWKCTCNAKWQRNSIWSSVYLLVDAKTNISLHDIFTLVSTLFFNAEVSLAVFCECVRLPVH